MADLLQPERTRPQVVRAAQVAREAEVRLSANGVHFAMYGETGVTLPDLDRMLEAVPATIVGALQANTYYFVPLALRETAETLNTDQPMVVGSYSDEMGDAAICHRNVELGSGQRGVFISTRLMGDRFALCFEFFINVAHALVDQAGVPPAFAELVWQQALSGTRGETSMDAWESRNLALGLPINASPEPPPARRARFASRGFGSQPVATPAIVDEKEKTLFLDSAFSDAVAIYLLSLALDFDYNELREREYPLLAPGALAARLKLVAELFPPNEGYEFAVKYRRRA